MHLPTDRDWHDWRPIRAWVFVKADPRVKKTAGGIHLPDQIVQVERVMEGTGRVLRVGNEVEKTCGYLVKEGDRICFRGFLKDAFHEFKEEDGCRIFMLKADDILAVIDEDIQMGEFIEERKAS
jgi:co-chaperonin GroES (HSP10)